MQKIHLTPGPRQSLRVFSVRFICPPSPDLATIDAWLQTALAIEPETFPGLPVRQGAVPHPPAAELIWRGLLIVRQLLQYVSIPAFAAGQVLKVEQDSEDPGKWHAAVAVAKIEYISPKCYSVVINAALKIVQWLVGRPMSWEHVAELHTNIEKLAKTQLRHLVPAGKSTLPVLNAAYRQDIPFTHLGAGVYQLGWGSRSRRIDRSTTEEDSAIGSRLSQNKALTAALLRAAGLPAAEHGVATTREQAMRIAHQIGWPVVVKPVDLDRGEGVTIGIGNDDQLALAFDAAKKLGRTKQVIVERQVPGTCHRLFIAGGQLLYAVNRLPKSVRGDGRRTVAELVREANREECSKPPWQRTELYPDDELALATMAAAGHALDSIPGEGEWVSLREIESTRWGGRDEDVTRQVHPANVDVAVKAATLFRLNVVGVDIISPDIRIPWYENGAIINEVNFSPLLGGAEISRSYLPDFIARLIDGDGRIPVEAVVGGSAALQAARARQAELAAGGVACYLTSHRVTLDPAGVEVPMPFTSLVRRCRALLLNRQVAAIVLVVQTDELLHAGLSVDCITRLTEAGGGLISADTPDHPVAEAHYRRLLAQLRSLCLPLTETC